MKIGRIQELTSDKKVEIKEMLTGRKAALVKAPASILTKGEILAYLSVPDPLIDGLMDPAIQIQSNGIDLSVASISAFWGPGAIDFSNQDRKLSDTVPIKFNQDGWIDLPPGSYLVNLNETINLPLDIMAMTWPRSSLLRMGVTVGTAIWDAGYKGSGQTLLIVSNPHGVRISKNARIIQLVFVRLSRETEGYKGIYQNG